MPLRSGNETGPNCDNDATGLMLVGDDTAVCDTRPATPTFTGASTGLYLILVSDAGLTPGLHKDASHGAALDHSKRDLSADCD